MQRAGPSDRTQRRQALSHLKAWTRERFTLSREATISVAEISCTLPGCPPLETVVAFWIEEQRYQFKIFKPMAEVGPGDLPYAWLRDALAVEDGVALDCC